MKCAAAVDVRENKELCRDCRDHGHDVPATRKLASGTKLCEQHFAGRMGRLMIAGSPKLTRRIETVPKTLDIDWSKVQAERDAGVPVSDLCEKYGASSPVIYRHTHESGSKKTRRAGRTDGRNVRSKASANGYGAMIADLEAKREQLDRAIACLRELNGG